ncbi:hypothetical protein JTB14_021894 [Gonioctena quinquepunctata]|nr:hypothetical protein JTB14_021894 [Gonioctena quinquepunctata]
MEIEIELRIKENEDIKKSLDEMLQSSSDAKQKLSELVKKIKDESSKVDSATENLEKLVNTNKSTLEPLQKEICLLKDQNVHMKETLEKKIKIYTDKLEEKNKIITTKMVLNEKVNLERQLEASIEQLDEQISLKKKKTEVLQGEVQRVIEDNSLQDLKKNKAYLISSRKYLTEKFDNITARQNQAKSSQEAVQNQNYNLKIRLEERQKVVMNLKKQLEELEATKKTDPLTSILKRPVNSKLNSCFAQKS